MSPGLLAIRGAMVFLALASTGCSFGNGPEFLRRYERPGPGQEVPESFWTEARAEAVVYKGSTETADQDAIQVSFWLLPTWVSLRHTATPAQVDRVADTEFRVLDLGVICIPLLPLWLSTQTQIDRPSGERAETEMTWTPLWTATSSADWPADEPRASAGGVPLLYGWIEYGRDGEAPDFALHNVLWTLGPAWVHGERTDVDAHPTIVGLGSSQSGWSFVPLLLAGPGAWLWTSSELRGANASEQTVHGPLDGWLGYRSNREALRVSRGPTVRDEFTRHVLAGALWYDREELAGDDVMDSRHGPLWGAFGWGRRDGEPALYLLWFPIEL